MTANDIKRILGTVGVDPKHMFHGVYMASVVNVNDPLSQGRVTLKIPQVLGTATSNWADPLGFKPSTVPAPGTIVHAYFTGGDINFPIYVTISLDSIEQQITSLQNQINSIGPGNWVNIDLLNGWSNVAGFLPAQVRVLTPGAVQLAGTIQGGAAFPGFPVALISGGFFNTTSSQSVPFQVLAGAASDPAVISGSTDTSGLNNGTVNGLSGVEGLNDGTINGNSASASGAGAHIHGAGGYAVTNGTHNHDSGSFAVADGNHSHTLSPLNVGAFVDNNSPVMTLGTDGFLTLVNISPNATQISFNTTLVV